MALDTTQDPYLTREIGAELNRIAAYRADADRCSGVRFSGMEPARYVPRTVAQLQAAADKAREQAQAFAQSPRGRFLAAVREIGQLPTYEHNAERLAALYSRSLADDRQPLNVRAVGAAITILTGTPGKAARQALDALAELLMTAQPAAA